jgi:hypothetical protein
MAGDQSQTTSSGKNIMIKIDSLGGKAAISSLKQKNHSKYLKYKSTAVYAAV